MDTQFEEKYVFKLGENKSMNQKQLISNMKQHSREDQELYK